MTRLLGFTFLMLTFFHGAFASGFIPILKQNLGESSTLAFTLYFVGILIGQLSIYKFKFLSRNAVLYLCYEFAFGGSLILMAFWGNETGLTVGRFIEGVAAGLALPLLFSNLMNTECFGTLGKRIALFNSIFALGFVLGPVMVDLLLQVTNYQLCLYGYGALFMVISMPLLLLRRRKMSESKSTISLKNLLLAKDSFEKFFTLFFAKIFYGFLLAYTTGHFLSRFESTPVSVIMLCFSAIFILGQFLTNKIVSKFPKEHLATHGPIWLALLLLFFYWQDVTVIFFIAALFHSMLTYIGYLNFGSKATCGREFALFSSISDPGMILGSLLATFGGAGIWGIAILAPLPLIHFLLSDPSKVRAERFFPFVGILTILKVLKRHKKPLKDPIDEIIEHLPELSLKPSLSDKKKLISICFTGDFCPSKHNYTIDNDLKRLILSHDLRVLNLEGTSTTKKYDKLNDKLFFDIPENQLQNIVNSEGDKKNFNVLSFSNNHILDRKQEAFQETLDEKSDLGLVTDQLKVIECEGIKIGVFALTYGINAFWRKHDRIWGLKPQKLLLDGKERETLLSRIESYQKEVDLLIMSYHWGYECEYIPSEMQRNIFEMVAKAGVDILYGHHSHIVQPYQYESGKLCLYSCGNLVSDMPLPIYQQGAVFSVEISKMASGVEVSKVTPHFFEMRNEKLSTIKNCESLSYQNLLRLKTTT